MTRDQRIAWRRVDPSTLDLKGWRVAVIGGTGGLGRAVSRFLASRGARVSVVGQTFRDSDVPGIEFIKADLSLMREAERIGKALPAEDLDLVVFTTGIFAAPSRQETAEGIERDMAVSYLSRLVILRGIAPRLGKRRAAMSIRPRVFIMGYPGSGQAGTLDDLNAERGYKAMAAHMNTVAGNEILVLDSATRYPNAVFFGLNPGLVRTNIRDNFLGKDTLKSRFVEAVLGLLAPSPEAYAERLASLLVSRDLEGHSGAMFDRKGNAIVPSPKLMDVSYTSAFIAASEALVEARASVRLSV
jgi:NAD(P)-dependent dehydrogenase (short-subunit alcohol dehydrogenase family)